jgi:predicted nucleotidyltransferase
MKVKWDEKAMSSLEETCLASTLVSNLFAWDWQCIQIVLGPERNFKLMRSLVLRKPHECEFVTRLLKLDMFQLFGLKVWFQYGKRRRRNIKRVEREEIVGILEKALREEELKSIRFVGSYADGEEEVDHISVLIVLASDSYDDIESRLFELEVDGILRFLISSRHSRQETWEKIDRIPQAAL